MALLIHIDGGARGNPGPAGAGISITTDDGHALYEAGFFLGSQTNNVAEYRALILALERVQDLPAQPVIIHSDSELLVRQITGEYRVKNPRLAQLYEQAQMLLLRLGVWNIQHVRREQNRRADELANVAMDQRRNVIVTDVHRPASQNAPAETATNDPEMPEPSPSQTAIPAPPPPNALQPAHGQSALHAGYAIQVSVKHAPADDACPNDGCGFERLIVDHKLSGDLCVFAAHALMPTLLAMLNTDAHEFAAVPTLTVRCTNPACGATFQLSSMQRQNGKGDKTSN